MIRSLVCFATSFLTASVLSAQIGIIGSFQTFKADKWEKLILRDLPGHSGLYPVYGFGVGIDYWFRLKNRRIEFTPELSYSVLDGNFDGIQAEHKLLGFFFFTNVYPFDLASDCNCPTWSKDGDIFSRGFFIQLAPGINYLENKTSDQDVFDQPGKELTFGGAVGAGLDFGISDFLTLTPIGRYYFYPEAYWNQEDNPANSGSRIGQFFAGLKLGFRWKGSNKFKR